MISRDGITARDSSGAVPNDPSVAQWIRASGYDPEGWEFESLLVVE